MTTNRGAPVVLAHDPQRSIQFDIRAESDCIGQKIGKQKRKLGPENSQRDGNTPYQSAQAPVEDNARVGVPQVVVQCRGIHERQQAEKEKQRWNQREVHGRGTSAP